MWREHDREKYGKKIEGKQSEKEKVERERDVSTFSRYFLFPLSQATFSLNFPSSRSLQYSHTFSFYFLTLPFPLSLSTFVLRFFLDVLSAFSLHYLSLHTHLLHAPLLYFITFVSQLFCTFSLYSLSTFSLHILDQLSHLILIPFVLSAFSFVFLSTFSVLPPISQLTFSLQF